MTQRAVMTPGNPNLSYGSAVAQATSTVGTASTTSDDSPDSDTDFNPDLWSSQYSRQRFPGWLRLVIIGGGALLGWAAIAGVAALLR